jgi:hypothetical protein
MHTNPDMEYAEQTAATTRSLYAAPHRLTPLDLPRGADVRAPGQQPGLLAADVRLPLGLGQVADHVDQPLDPQSVRRGGHGHRRQGVLRDAQRSGRRPGMSAWEATSMSIEHDDRMPDCPFAFHRVPCP